MWHCCTCYSPLSFFSFNAHLTTFVWGNKPQLAIFCRHQERFNVQRRLNAMSLSAGATKYPHLKALFILNTAAGSRWMMLRIIPAPQSSLHLEYSGWRQMDDVENNLKSRKDFALAHSSRITHVGGFVYINYYVLFIRQICFEDFAYKHHTYLLSCVCIYPFA